MIHASPKWELYLSVTPTNYAISCSGGSRNFVQGVPISFWKNFESFRSISGCFSKYWLKFKIWPAWSLCLKKKMFLKPKQIYILYTKKSQKEKKVINNVIYIPLIGCLF